MNLKNIAFVLISSMALACSTDSQTPPINNGGTSTSAWSIPQSQVLDGGPGKDGIPALTNPETFAVAQIDYLSDNDLVVGFFHNGEHRAYPHNILDWHEIINDDLNGKKVAVTYCPLTGTGIAWNRILNGTETTFGVSGLLYNTNLIPYDRMTDSNWCQISLECVNGALQGQEATSFHLIETTWKTWKEMFPKSSAVTTNTGFSRNYGRYPYGDYKTNDSRLLFPVSSMDDRLPAKERVLAIIENDKAKVYRFNSFKNGLGLVMDQFEGKEIVVVGDEKKNFMVAFENNLNGTQQSFSPLIGTDPSVVFGDDKGNEYDLFGNVIEGPDKGESLNTVTSFMAYWFSIGAFYSRAIISENN